jgi:hypothetical protein
MLFTGRLIITDSFLVNNPNLEILFNEDPNGFSTAIEKGIILPAMRTNISNLGELYANFVEKSDAQTNLNYIHHIEQSINQNVSWELSDIELEFTTGLLSTINSEYPLYGKINTLIQSGLRDDLTRMYESHGKFNRLDLTNLINNKYKSIDLPASELLLGMISTKYQTNIPDLLKIEIAYPESPESLVSGLDLIKESRLIHSNNQYDVSN